MLRTLREEGFEIRSHNLMRLRRQKGWMLRGPNANDEKSAKKGKRGGAARRELDSGDGDGDGEDSGDEDGDEGDRDEGEGARAGEGDNQQPQQAPSHPAVSSGADSPAGTSVAPSVAALEATLRREAAERGGHGSSYRPSRTYCGRPRRGDGGHGPGPACRRTPPDRPGIRPR